MIYSRAMRYQLPLVRGEDVLAVQLRLRQLGLTMVGQPDGLFGRQTDLAIRQFQVQRNLKVDGIVGPRTWTRLFDDTEASSPEAIAAGSLPATAPERVLAVLDELKLEHGFHESCRWRLTAQGLVIDQQAPETTGGEPATVRQVWQRFGQPIQEWAASFSVPVELIIATICTETRGNPTAVREEPGYVSDQATPAKVSPGLMQTLISTARGVLGDPTIDRYWLFEPGNSIRAGTAYIASQWKLTHLDPPKVACAYNAGGVYYNRSPRNRWRMRQYPIDSAEHADRFVQWFNDCFVMFAQDQITPNLSFFTLLRQGAAAYDASPTSV